MKKMQSAIQAMVISILFTISIFGNDILFDTTYNGTGYSIKPLAVSDGTFIYITSFVLQSDGKAVIGGYVSNQQSQTSSYAVMRLNTDGTLDTSFGSGGTVFESFGSTYSSGGYVAIQPDGKIIVAGSSASALPNEGIDYLVARLTADGQRDTTFNGTGYASFTIGNAFDWTNAVALQPDGKIVLVGRSNSHSNNSYDIGVLRVNTNGSLDTTFNGTGIVKIGEALANEEGYAVSIQPDGKLIIGGAIIPQNSFLTTWIGRLNADGTIDTSFGNNGIRTGNGANFFKATAVLPDGKILAAGGGVVGGAVVRYTANGTLDTSFGTNGENRTDTNVIQLLPQSDGKFFVVSEFGVIRYLKNGAIDTKYSVRPSVFGSRCPTVGAAIINNEKIMVGGGCPLSQGSTTTGFAAMRFQEYKTKRYLDFTGDGRSDISIFNPSLSRWTIRLSTENYNTTTQFGNSTDRPVSADFTGDGRADIAVFRPSTGEWLVMRSENSTTYSYQFGLSEDIPVPADYDGDQIDDIAVYRPSTGTWFILRSTGGVTYENFGLSTDKVVPSDYDGDFKTDIAIYRSSNGQWWIKRSSDGLIYAFEFGTAEDKPVQGDYTGDGKSDAAFYRPSTGQWFILRSEDSSYYGFPFGLSDDLPAPGNYQGDSRFDAALYRPSTNRWYLLTAEGTFSQLDIGTSGDRPVSNYFVQ